MKLSSILLVAYQCGPGMGSVSQIGWEWYARLSAEHRVSLVTHVRNRPALEAAHAPLADSEILYIDTEWFAGPLYRLARRLFPRSEHSVFLIASLDYFLFDFVAYRTLKRRLRGQAGWELLHRVTPVTLSAPSWLARLGLPTVMGPLNSGLQDPLGFDGILKQESTWLTRARGFGQLLDILLGSTRRTDRILTASRSTLQAVSPPHRVRCRMMAENAVELARFPATPWPPAPGTDQPLRVLFVGRLIPLKGLDMLLRAIARLRQAHCSVMLDIVGDGPMQDEWRQLSRSLQLDACVRFHGNLSLDAVAVCMQHCHVFCLPSVRESGGAVLLEAMASARPVIALAYGGPAEIVTDKVGALLPMSSPAQVIDDLTVTLLDIPQAPQIWQQRGLAGRRLIEKQYCWPAKIAATRHLYLELLAEREPSC